MSSLTWRISAESAVFPGQHQTRTGMPSRVTAIPITIWGRSSRWSLELPRPRNPPVSGLLALRPPPCSVPAAGHGLAVLVPRHRLVFLVHLEIGAGGVEEQQVHFKVQGGRDLAEDLPAPPRAGPRAASPSPGSTRRRSSPGSPSIQALRPTQCAAASLEDGSSARLATSANSTRSVRRVAAGPARARGHGSGRSPAAATAGPAGTVPPKATDPE